MKIIVSTSNAYQNHLLPIFTYLFNKNWGAVNEVAIIGYDTPRCALPPNFTFHSLGKQGHVMEFSNDMRRYFETQDDYFIWCMEDSFIKSVDHERLESVKVLAKVPMAGRIYLSRQGMRQKHEPFGDINGYTMYSCDQDSMYRLSTMPSIWSKEFLLKYLKPGLSPWAFELQQPTNDGYLVLGPTSDAVSHIEGTTKHNIYNLSLDGIKSEQIDEMTKLGII